MKDHKCLINDFFRDQSVTIMILFIKDVSI